ncbi:MAG TPA: single-stranded DNA-binding protein [Bacteroidales bacterium]
MTGVNKVILVGNLGKDPEVQTFDNDIKKATFSLATSSRVKNKEGIFTEETEWHKVVVWRKLAETAEAYLHKGSLLYVEGRLRTHSWDDKDGNKRYTTEVIADTFTMLGPRKDQDGNGEPAGSPEQEAPNSPVDDLPF